jgi:hypothetical protein
MQSTYRLPNLVDHTSSDVIPSVEMDLVRYHAGTQHSITSVTNTRPKLIAVLALAESRMDFTTGNGPDNQIPCSHNELLLSIKIHGLQGLYLRCLAGTVAK